MQKLLLALMLAASGSVASAGAPRPIDGAWVLSAEATEAVVNEGRIEDPRRFSDFLGLGSTFLVVFTYEFKGQQGQVTLPRDPRGRGFHLVSSEAHTAVYEDDGTQQRFTVSVERGGR